MPGFDGRGPAGTGPAAGRRTGWCDSGLPWSPAAGRGYYGRGPGPWPGSGPGRRPCRSWFERFCGAHYRIDRPEPANEKDFLREQAKELRAELSLLEQRLGELEKGAE